ncbi:hypothetical protein GF373_08585 [bacterium]|nr:hypothetical protein [bacterium]
MNQSSQDRIIERLNRLEKQNRWLKQGFLFLIIGFTSLLGLGLADTSDSKQEENGIVDVVETKELRLRNEAGDLVAWLKPDPESGASFSLIDKNGISRIHMGIHGSVAQVALVGQNRGSQIVMESTMFGPQINLFDTVGHNRCILGTYKDETYLWIVDKNEERRAGISIDPNQTGFLLHDANGHNRFHFGFSKDSTEMTIKNAKGETIFYTQ